MKPAAVGPDHAACRDAVREAEDRMKKLLALRGKKSLDDCHRELGLLMWEKCGMGRNRAGLEEAIAKIPEVREEFWKNVFVPGSGEELNARSRRRGGSPASSSSAS